MDTFFSVSSSFFSFSKPALVIGTFSMISPDCFALPDVIIFQQQAG